MSEKERQIPEFGQRREVPREESDEMPEEMMVAREVSKLAAQAAGQSEQPQQRPEIPQEPLGPGPNVASEEIGPVAPPSPPIAETSAPSIPINKVKSANEIIARLKEKQKYEEVLLPSKNLTYGGFGLERNKPIHVKPMTIEEEKVLSTPRLIRSGEAIDRIYESCMYENIPASKLLSPDRIFLLFYIRGISYGPEYDIDVKCPSCETPFSESINLNTLEIDYCKDDFTGEVHQVLPDSGLDIWYRIPCGEDERSLTKYREMRVKNFAGAVDDTLTRRNTMLITRVNTIENQMEIEQIVNNLGVKDSNFLRDRINNPGFGPQTDIYMSCPYCFHEWTLDLPIDANFFFPRTKTVS